MKLFRYLDSRGKEGFAARQADGSAFEITGDVLGDFSVSSQKADVKKVLAPIALPPAIFCIGLNYRQHAAETKGNVPEFPILFMKSSAAIQNPDDPIEIPTHLKSDRVDYECELAIIIGKRCKNVSKEQALDYVLGYTCANDVSARDWQIKWGGTQWCRAKTFDTFCPLGPVIVTKDEIPNPNALAIKTTLNGQVMQSNNTSDMIFDVPTLISFLSGSTTLLPGSVILTGTPEGVGMARDPRVWLKHGDTVTVEVEKIGQLTNPVINE